MSTAVVQLFTTEAPTHSTWVKRLSGIACFVKDSSKRSYFIRVYCMMKHEMVLEEEMYETILINKPREFMITFEGQVWMTPTLCLVPSTPNSDTFTQTHSIE